ncbi:hypothetical protein CEXT_332561 [Caerostris extrusa]|uniref:Uncharacterized protein n=1 Tax=Caerostris extrusa TaxID=172846 RepID=A0AAV4TPE1_CAEEX|nr:hypothetical protein CEXT_332561 [Caerostris extrusa]
MASDVAGDGGHSVGRGARHSAHGDRHHPHQEDQEEDARPEKGTPELSPKLSWYNAGTMSKLHLEHHGKNRTAQHH